jgi:hypothetical protein
MHLDQERCSFHVWEFDVQQSQVKEVSLRFLYGLATSLGRIDIVSFQLENCRDALENSVIIVHN